jgi:hypothetical protein
MSSTAISEVIYLLSFSKVFNQFSLLSYFTGYKITGKVILTSSEANATHSKH